MAVSSNSAAQSRKASEVEERREFSTERPQRKTGVDEESTNSPKQATTMNLVNH